MSITSLPTSSRPKLLLNLSEVAGQLGVSVQTVKNRVRTGAIPSVKEGGLRRVRPADLEAYVNGLPITEPGDATAI